VSNSLFKQRREHLKRNGKQRTHEYKNAKEYKTQKELDNSFNHDYCNGFEMVQRKVGENRGIIFFRHLGLETDSGRSSS
jgi:hypothetical protein